MDLENIVVSLAKNKSDDVQENLIKMVGGHSNHVWRYKGAQEIVLKKYLKVPQGSLFENSLQEEEKALKTVKKITEINEINAKIKPVIMRPRHKIGID